MSAENTRTPTDWGLFIALTLLWAVAYPSTRLAVNMSDPAHGFPPQMVIAGRLTLGAIFLMTAAIIRGERFPRLSDYRRWRALFILGFIGMTAPFFVITTAQKTVDSSLAALSVAAAPLFVSVIAHFRFHDEKLTSAKVIGLLVGFGGVGLMFGPDAIANFGSASVWAQLLLLLGTMFYAVSTVTARSAPLMSPLMKSAAFVALAAVISWLGLFTVDFAALDPAPASYLGIVILGIAPTALASLLYMQLVARTSATFLSLTGYTIPVVSALIGFVAFGEVQAWYKFLAFGLILLGVWLSQNAGRQRPV